MKKIQRNHFQNLNVVAFLKAVFVFVLVSVSVGYVINFLDQIESKKQGQKPPEVKQSVTVSGSVKIERITFTVYPEKRTPSVGNWSTTVDVAIRHTGSPTAVITKTGIVTNSSGLGTITLSPSETLTPGNYDFAIKGISHLRRNYTNYNISSVREYFDFSLTGNHLLAGDTSLVIDNYVNSLDVSTVAKNFYTAIEKEDLNRDGIVNSLDLSIQIANLYKTGDV